MEQVPHCRRAGLQADLEYFLNMSSVGAMHPWAETLIPYVRSDYEVDVEVERRHSGVWSWYRLAKSCNLEAARYS